MCLVILVAVGSLVANGNSCVQAGVHITFSRCLALPDTALWMCKFACYIFHIMGSYSFCGCEKSTSSLCLARLLFLNTMLSYCVREKNIKAESLVRVMWFLMPLRYTKIWWGFALIHIHKSKLQIPKPVICVMENGDEYSKSPACTNDNFISRLHSLEDLSASEGLKNYASQQPIRW